MTSTISSVELIRDKSNQTYPLPSLLTIRDLAKLSGISLSFLYKAVERREVPHFRIGSQIRFSYEDVTRWLKDARVEVIESVPN